MPTVNYDETDYYLSIIDKQENMIMIKGRDGMNIIGFVDGETVFSTTAAYNNELAGQGAFEIIGDIDKGMSPFTPGMDTAARVVPAQMLTRVVWQNSTLNTLAFDLYLPSTTRGTDVMTMGKLIFDFTLPESLGVGQVYTPNRYAVNENGKQENLLGVFIGKWFSSPNSWVMTSGNLTVSKEKLKGDNKKPLYVKVSVVLQPGKHFRAEQVKAWFK